MKHYKLVTLIALLTTSFSAFSSHHGRNELECVREKWTLMKTDLKVPNVCEIGRELQLAEAFVHYPYIDVGPLKVHYWQGRYQKTESKKETYKHEYINICTGMVTYSSEEVLERSRVRAYDIQNPNLDRSIKESYKLVPLTDEEASRAFDNLKIECETVLLE
jgi:hypothetical protein